MLLVYPDFLSDFAKDKTLTLTDRRVFCYLLAQMDPQNLIKLPQKELSKELEIPRPNISNSLNKLANSGYIRIGREGNLNIYQVNQNCASKCRDKKEGTPFTLKAEKEEQNCEDKIEIEENKKEESNLNKPDTSVTKAFNKLFSL